MLTPFRRGGGADLLKCVFILKALVLGDLVLTLSTRIYTWLFENRQPARNASMAGRICVCYPMRFSNLKYSFRYGSDDSLAAGSLCRSQKNSTAENPHLFM